ncbi:hypothetical protein ACJX0J_029334, partial [Zea mays]
IIWLSIKRSFVTILVDRFNLNIKFALTVIRTAATVIHKDKIMAHMTRIDMVGALIDC